MKKISLIMLVFAAFVFSSFTMKGDSKEIQLRVEYSFKGIDPGTDFSTKTEVYLDGNLCGTSTIRKESMENVVVCKTTKGNHHIRVVNYVNVGGDDWKERTPGNGYSIDGRYESNLELKKKNSKIVLLYDLDNGIKREK